MQIINSPKAMNLQESSYFRHNSDIKDKPKIFLSARPKENNRIYDKINNAMMVKSIFWSILFIWYSQNNSKYHLLLMNKIKSRNSLKFWMSKVFNSLTRGSFDLNLLKKPTFVKTIKTHSEYLNQNLKRIGNINAQYSF